MRKRKGHTAFIMFKNAFGRGGDTWFSTLYVLGENGIMIMLTLFEAIRAAIPTGMKSTPTSMKTVITCAIVKQCHLPSDVKL